MRLITALFLLVINACIFAQTVDELRDIQASWQGNKIALGYNFEVITWYGLSYYVKTQGDFKLNFNKTEFENGIFYTTKNWGAGYYFEKQTLKGFYNYEIPSTYFPYRLHIGLQKTKHDSYAYLELRYKIPNINLDIFGQYNRYLNKAIHQFYKKPNL